MPKTDYYYYYHLDKLLFIMLTQARKQIKDRDI